MVAVSLDKKTKGRKTAKREEVRTREGDQTQSLLRKPVQKEQEPVDLLDKEGYDDWREVKIHWGNQQGTPLGKLTAKSLSWWIKSWTPKMYKGAWANDDLILDAALVLASAELGGGADD